MKIIYLFLCLCATLVFCLALKSCVFISTKVKPLEKTSEKTVISSPAKAHLYDGSLIVFADGFVMSEGIIKGNGIRYDLTREPQVTIDSISIDSIACLEYYKKELQAGPFLGSLSAPLLFLAAIQNEDIYKAFFGSCPTVYSFDGEKYTLEAECFSYSVSPSIETDDLDRIDHGKVINGDFVLNIRNEALETHYINQMKLLAVDHPKEYEPFPANRKFLERKDQIILFGQESDIIKATSKSGQNVAALLTARDEKWYRSAASTVQELSKRVTRDWVEVATEVPEGAKIMNVAIRFRNTLFHTIVFYDLLLDGEGVRGIDWMGVDMADPIYLSSLYDWYQKYFGIDVQLWDKDGYEQKIHIDDTGPIAWRQVAFELPVPRGQEVRIRFEFLADNVMLDWVGISFDTSPEFTIRELDCQEIIDNNGKRNKIDPSTIKLSDNQYLITSPAESYFINFEVEDERNGMKRTYFLKSRGFYIEWIRHDWLLSSATVEDDVKFELNEATLVRTARHWLARKPHFEKQFFESRISHQGEKSQ